MKKHITFLLILGLWSPMILNAQWQHLGSGLDSTQAGAGKLKIWTLEVIDSLSIWALPVNSTSFTNFEEKTYCRSLDGGLTWETGIVSTDIGYTNSDVFALNKDTAWWTLSLLPNYNRAKIYRTNNGGQTWTEQTGPFNNLGQHVDQVHFFDDSVGIAYGTANKGISADSIRIYQTDDGGSTWDRISPALLPHTTGIEDLEINSGSNNYDARGDTLWFGTGIGRVWRTIDRGTTWTAINVYPGSAAIISIQFENHLKGMVVNKNWSSGARTEDGGATWTLINLPFRAFFVDYIPGTDGHYFISSLYESQAKHYMSTDNGSTWNPVHYSYPVSLSAVEFLSPSDGFAGSWVDQADSGGVYRWIGDLANGYQGCNACLQTVNDYPHLEGFEGNGGSWCQWDNDNRDWTLNSGPTSTSGTGPVQAEQGNYYSYMPSSIFNINMNAMLVSPCYELDSNCVDSAWFYFSYHMQGFNPGNLQVMLSLNNGVSWPLILWTKTGDQGPNWQRDSVDLSAYIGQTVKIGILGETGNSQVAEIAIDNLLMRTESALEASYNLFDNACAGDSSGQISVIPNGGTNPYIYSWSTGATTSSLTNLMEGTYQVTVTDSNACVLQEEVVLTDPPPLTLTLNPDPVNCHSDTNGKINTQAGGGSGSLSYLWSNGGTNPNLSNLAPGLYTVTLTDAHGCNLLDSAMVTEPDPLDPNFAITDVSCPGDSNGAVAFVPLGGTPPYNYIWFGGSDSIVENLAPGSYSYTLADSKFCFTGGSFAIGEPDLVSAQFEVHDISCFGQMDGKVIVHPQGGNGGFSYLWSNGEITDSLSGLGVGTISVLLTDSLGCTGEGSTSINEPAELLVDLLKIDESAIGASDGSIDLTVMGGNPPYAFAWSSGDTTEDLSGLPGDNSIQYVVTVTDANGCTKVDSVSILIGLEEGWAQMPLKIYPNPANDELMVIFETNSAGIAWLEIYDQQGRRLFRREIAHTYGVNELKLSVGDLASGSYWLSVRTQKEVGYLRWVKI